MCWPNSLCRVRQVTAEPGLLRVPSIQQTKITKTTKTTKKTKTNYSIPASPVSLWEFI